MNRVVPAKIFDVNGEGVIADELSYMVFAVDGNVISRFIVTVLPIFVYCAPLTVNVNPAPLLSVGVQVPSS